MGFRAVASAFFCGSLLILHSNAVGVSLASAASIELPCILQNGCECNHTLPYTNPSDGQTYGTCIECDDGYTGPTCARPRVDCQNLGALFPNGTCECPPMWAGDACTDKLCINSVNGVGPHSIRPPKNNFCDECKEGFAGLSCDMCTADSGCAASAGGPKCGRQIAVPQTERYNMLCSVDEAFLKPLGPKRDIEARVGYECQSPSGFKNAKDAECAVSFYRIEEKRVWMDAFFFCTGYECSMEESTIVKPLPEDTASAKHKFFDIVKAAGQVALLTLCLLISIARYIPGPKSAQNSCVRYSTLSLFIVLVVYVFTSLVLMSSPAVETIRQVTYTCDRTACVCGEDPPSRAYTPFCSDSAFGQYILPTITHKTKLTCNAGTGDCLFEPEDVPTQINLKCEASECIPANATQVGVRNRDSSAEGRGRAWLFLALSAVLAVALGALHYAMVARASKASRAEFAGQYLSSDAPHGDEADAGAEAPRGAASPRQQRRQGRSSLSHLSVDMGTVVTRGGIVSDDDGDDPLSDPVPEEEGFESEGDAARLMGPRGGGGVGGGLSADDNNNSINTQQRRQAASPSPAPAPQPTLPAHQYTLRASGLAYRVAAPDWAWGSAGGGRYKHILRDVCFSAKSGDVVALMGASGAGKTTLLDILAARQKSGEISGELRIDGVDVLANSAHYRALVGYVAQEDTLLPSLTVRQTLLYAARLKLPTAFSSKTIRRIIDELMAAMGITRCAHTIIGDGHSARGLSGGEKRRVSIAVEMVANPRILFLDEPTSGLDASNALRVMEAVSLLARTSPLAKYAPHYFSFRPIIIASIHQPSNAIFSRFTSLVLMSRGRAIYAGGRAEALGILAGRIADEARVPSVCDSPAEGLLLIDDRVTDEERERLAEASASDNNRTQAAAAEEGSAAEEARPSVADSVVVVGGASGVALLEEVQSLKRFYASSYAQLFLLVRRSYASLMGSYYLIAAHGLVTVFMGSLMCILYSAEPLSLPGALNRAGSITFLLLVQSFISLSALEQLMTERKLFITERENGFYSTMPYLVSKLVVDVMPLRMIPAIVVGAIIYFPMGLRTDDGSYFLWFLVILTLFTVCISLCVMCIGVMTSSFGAAALISSVVILWNFVFGGLLVQAETIPNVLQPFRNISPFYAAFEALLVNELDGQMCTFAPTDAAGRPSDTVIPLHCAQYLFNLGLHPDRFVKDVATLGLECILFILIAYLLLLRAQLTR